MEWEWVREGEGEREWELTRGKMRTSRTQERQWHTGASAATSRVISNEALQYRRGIQVAPFWLVQIIERRSSDWSVRANASPLKLTEHKTKVNETKQSSPRSSQNRHQHFNTYPSIGFDSNQIVDLSTHMHTNTSAHTHTHIWNRWRLWFDTCCRYMNVQSIALDTTTTGLPARCTTINQKITDSTYNSLLTQYHIDAYSRVSATPGNNPT